ncbi:hypothetical protein BDV28DRAFT_4998 [Aspergillus coremiiformis]|uniref:Cyanovirin-N domain-containing protein n=1 Tax=Aspergillus coremiiformis TaxID=138285 RepID=A0A5N6Z3N7_9EURO|nr:hypothetical protein BDV28DRAFT_4998 [Aspergillus coremiiformis]
MRTTQSTLRAGLTSLALLCLFPSVTSAVSCDTTHISNHAVSQCDCATTFSDSGCTRCLDASCNNQPLKGKLTANTCGSGCVDQNINCDACGLYFNSLCRCLKGTATNCVSRGNWWLLNAHQLITTTQRVPGILQLGSDNSGWQLGQEILGSSTVAQSLTRADGTLSLNSVLVRDQEQIHIHLCENPKSQLRNYLSSPPVRRDNYQTLKPIPTSFPDYPQGSVRCQASLTKGAANINVAQITSDYLNTVPKACAQDSVGVGLITDGNDYSWVCVTTGEHSGEQLFCGTH